jgi:curved DNA-binding protein CbpA
MIDFYELVQISPNADADTIHRVYRFLAARYHPDNQNSGDAELFNKLKEAYDVLSDPVRRSEYDNLRRQRPQQPLSSTIDFLDNIDGELNRRLAVLAVLYYRRRMSPHMPEVSLAELEDRMGFPRDYLDFTLWYLQKKNFIAKADNAQYSLRAEGVDFVENERVKIPTLNRLLTSGSDLSIIDVEHAPGVNRSLTDISASAEASTDLDITALQGTSEPIMDRRVGAPDRRVIKVERRKSVRFPTDRRKIN